MEKHVVSLKLAKKLEKEGWNQFGAGYYWVNGELMYRTPNNILYKLSDGCRVYEPSNSQAGEMIKTFLASELLEKLPGALISIHRNEYGVGFPFHCRFKNHEENNKSLPNALAKMWLYLKKENLLGKE